MIRHISGPLRKVMNRLRAARGHKADAEKDAPKEPTIDEVFDASWKRNEAGYRYLADHDREPQG